MACITVTGKYLYTSASSSSSVVAVPSTEFKIAVHKVQMVKDAKSMFLSYLICQIISASLSCVLAPFSAYYGGKLAGVPYVK